MARRRRWLGCRGAPGQAAAPLMGQVKTATLSRHNAPPFFIGADVEAVRVRQLTGWMRWLFVELRMLSDFRTGQVETSWAVLRALMDCDSGERGGPAPFVPSVDQLRRAVRQLEAIGLVTRTPQDLQASEAVGRLFLKVPAAVGIGASGGKPARGSARVRKPRSHREKVPEAATVPPGVAPGDSTPEFITPSPLRDPELSTENRQRLDAVRDGIAARAQGYNRAPKGARTSPAVAGTPPGAAPPESAQADSSLPEDRTAIK